MTFGTLGSALMLSVALASSARAQINDDFESYSDTADLQTVWRFASLDQTTPNPAGGNQSLRRAVDDDGPGSGWFSDRQLVPALDLTGQRIAVWVRRDPASVDPTGVNISLFYAPSFFCQLDNNVPLDDSEWHEIVLDTNEGPCSSVDLTAVTGIGLGASNGSGVTGLLAANFDDFAVYMFRDAFEAGSTAGWSSSTN